jgi:F-type H+-transporting ATPase subunit gamma
MTDSLDALRIRIEGANDLQAVVRTMKALSASNITEYENAVQALNSYYDTVQQGLSVCLQQDKLRQTTLPRKPALTSAALIVFGSDQGLVGQFNDSLAQYVREQLDHMSSQHKVQYKIWVVGERMYGRLQDAGLPLESCFSVPNSVAGVTPLIADLLLASEHVWGLNNQCPLYLFHHQPSTQPGQYQAYMRKLLPLDYQWQKALSARAWSGPSLPETLGTTSLTLRALIREYLFVSIYQSCAESLASENASRLLAMQRAQKNIEEMLANLQQQYHQQRQETIDAELFDVVAGGNL